MRVEDLVKKMVSAGLILGNTVSALSGEIFQLSSSLRWVGPKENICPYIKKSVLLGLLLILIGIGLATYLIYFHGRTKLHVFEFNVWGMPGTYRNVEKILKGSLDSIPSSSSSVIIQIMSGKVYLRCKGKTLLGVVNKLLKTICLLTSPSNILSSQVNLPVDNLYFH